ncbi:MAG: hypothetical protein ABJL99_23765 [Aliishimia sp.]
MMRLICALILAFGLSACRFGSPDSISIAFSAYASTPVVVTDMSVNGQRFNFFPKVVRGKGDTNRPMEGAGRMLLGYPKGSSEMALEISWVELLTQRAFRATTLVSLKSLEISASGAAEFMPVFGPGGLLIVASDPIPKTAQDKTIVDVARVCAERDISADTDFAADPGEFAGLLEAVEATYPAAAASECPSS